MPGPHDPYARPFPAFPRVVGAWEVAPFRVRYHDLHLRTLAGPYSTVPHHHLQHEVILVEAGEYRCLVNGQPLRVRDRGAVLVAPGDLHEDCGADWVRYQALTFACLPGPAPERSANAMGQAGLADPAVRRLPGAIDELLACTARLAALGGEAAADPWTPALQDAIAEEFLWRLLRRLPAESLCPELQAALRSTGLASELRRLFVAHPGRQLAVAEMAAKLGLSERTLGARCRAELGVSPARYQVRFRIEQARQLVMYSGQALSDIAASLGFADQFHFSKVYKRVHGLAPLAHRRMASAGSDISRSWIDMPG